MATDEKYGVSIHYGATRINTVIADPVEDKSSAEFERFEDLAGKLVQVPKAELDEKLRDS